MESSKTPWENYPHIWKTQSAFFSWVRGGVRRSLWNKSPIKLEFIKNNRIRIVNPNPKGKVSHVWGAKCYLCNKDFPSKDVEVDHIKGGHSLKSLDDLRPFIEGIVCVSSSDLGFACKPCHAAKTLAEKSGNSFEESKVDKQVIAITKLPVAEVRKWITSNGMIPAANATKRKLQIKDFLMEKES